MTDLVSYAKALDVMVIPEIDSPAHSNSFGNLAEL